jgi:hypothetical protein
MGKRDKENCAFFLLPNGIRTYAMPTMEFALRCRGAHKHRHVNRFSCCSSRFFAFKKSTDFGPPTKL